jgi:ABC-2 type transport system permease protein
VIARIRYHLGAVAAFTRKELADVVRQPKLVLTLIVGPFLVLAIFGLGFRDRPDALRTAMVVQPGSELAERVGELTEALEPAIELVTVTDDAEAARRSLDAGEIDLVVVAPEDAVATVRAGEPAEVEVIHDELDPWDRAYIQIFSRASIDELNRAVLEEVARIGQERVDEFDDMLPSARNSAEAMADALRTGSEVEARIAQLELSRSLRIAEDQLGGGADLFRAFGPADGEVSYAEQLRGTRSAVDNLEPADPASVAEAEGIAAALADLEAQLSEVKALTPAVVVRPFVPSVEPLHVEEMEPTAFYAPGVLVVIVQHLAVTFGALSIVRERNLGIVDLFRVSPLNMTHIVIGKVIGYFILAASIGALATALVVIGFGIPMAGSWGWVAVVIALQIMASLGLGFVIAAVSSSDAQAVQFSMLALLFTIFFSGFVISLERLAAFVRPIAYAVPATAGVQSMHDVMFRGQEPRSTLLALVAGYAVVTLAGSIWMLHRRLDV